MSNTKLFIMKSKIYILAICCISFIFTACQNEGNDVKLPTGELSVVKTTDISKANVNKIETIFSDKDIKSFNSSTGEIIFKNLTAEEIEKRIDGYDSSLTYFIGDMRLFDSIFIVPEWSSAVYNDLSLVIVDSKCYLLNGYPSLDIIEYKKEEYKQLREENIQKNKNSWNIFIKYLEEKGIAN